jgi:hypothetical protein
MKCERRGSEALTAVNLTTGVICAMAANLAVIQEAKQPKTIRNIPTNSFILQDGDLCLVTHDDRHDCIDLVNDQSFSVDRGELLQPVTVEIKAIVYENQSEESGEEED